MRAPYAGRVRLKTLGGIEAEIRRLATTIGAPDSSLPTFGHSEDGGRPHIELAGHGFAYVIVERGEVLTRVLADEEDEILYRVFADVAFVMACTFERAHRIVTQDFRRVMFAKQVELLAVLASSWGDRRAREIASILRRHPFDDPPQQEGP
jgi:hypothetical protein